MKTHAFTMVVCLVAVSAPANAQSPTQQSPVQWYPVSDQRVPTNLPDLGTKSNGPSPAVPSNSISPSPSTAPCNIPSCNYCDDCYLSGTGWVNFQWLFWATSGQSLPSLVTASPAGTSRSLAGVLGTPNTTTIYGNNRTNDEFRSGFRMNAGLWLDDSGKFGMEGDFFFLGQTRTGFSAASNGSQIIARPFTNAVTGLPDSELVSFPGALAGSVSVSSSSNIIGAGLNFVHNLCCDCNSRVDLLYGYRYLNIRDNVTISEDLTSLPGQVGVVPGTRYQIIDQFKTENNFHGGVIGLSAERRFNWFFVGGRATVALGANTETTDIHGTTVITPPGGPSRVYTGGLLAQASNIGHYSNTVFAVMPELSIRAGVQLSDSTRIYASYNYLYLSNVVRAGDQIDLRVNPNQLPPQLGTTGPAFPTYTRHTTDFWAQGISIGLEYRF